MHHKAMKEAYEASQEEVKSLEAIKNIREVLSSIAEEYHNNISEDSLSFTYYEMSLYLDSINHHLRVLESLK